MITKKFKSILDINNIKRSDLYFNSTGYVNGIFESAYEIKRYIPKGKLLDLGCGSGFLSFILKDMGFDVHGIDTENNEMIDIFKGNASRQEKLWSFISNNMWLYDGIHIPFSDGMFDGVVLHAVYEHIEDKDQVIQEIERVLKPDGYIFMFRTPHRKAWQEQLTKAHTDLVSECEVLKQLRENNFTIVDKGKTDFMCWSMPGALQRVWNVLFPILNVIDKTALRTPLRNVAHNIKIVARKYV